MSNVQTREAREKHIHENPRVVDLVLPVHGSCADHAGLVAAARDLSWQTMTPAEQWEAMFGKQSDR